MSVLTNFFKLIKPAKTDGVKVSDFNANMDTIDTEMHKPPLTVNGIAPDSTTRNLSLNEVPVAGNLTSDVAQFVDGTFVQRTSGGSASIESGDAFISSIKGNMEHTGIIDEVINMTVNNVGDDDHFSATINDATWRAYVNTSDTYTFTYTSSWSETLSNYGITVTGTPVDGDTITVVYVKADRGTITPTTPTSFNSTGWNLYNKATGVARVCKYSDEYGFKVGGNYTSLAFSETPDGAQEEITVTDGFFNVPSDGYVFVTGGDATTYIYATWTTWIDGYPGNFSQYVLNQIDLTGIMVSFPYGLLAVGTVKDEINFNTGKLIQRVERLSYDDNIAAVIESGLPYDADENYVYVALSEPVELGTTTVTGEYSVNDHGIEFFDGTSVPAECEILYGENLKDKLRTDVVTISAQTLTSAQKAQVRTNIGAVSIDAFANVGTKVDGTNKTGRELTWSDGDWHEISSLTLGAGTWLLLGQAAFSTSFTQVCGVSFYNVGGGYRYNTARTVGNVGGGCFCATFTVINSGSNTYKLYAMQGSGSSKTVGGMYFSAVRIKG